jgi:hypothetical protein
MSPPSSSRFVRLLDFLDARWWLAGAVAACLAFGVSQCAARDRAIRAGAVLEHELRRAERASAQWQLLWVEANERVKVESVTVTRQVVKYQTLRDTLMLAPKTADDTALALRQFPAFARQADSAVAACVDYQVSCSRFRVASDSLTAALRRENALMQDHVRRARTRSTLERLGDLAIGAGGGYLLGRLTD